STTFALIVDNVAPAITGLSSSNLTPYTSSADGTVTINGAFSDPAGSLDTYTAVWGDGTAPESLVVDQSADTFSGGHTYANGGIFTVTVTVADEDGGISDALTTTAAVVGVGEVDGTLYVIGTPGRDDVEINLVKHGGSDGGSDGGADRTPMTGSRPT
ncbi:MAG: PKD domain-containing protein, partial [Pirellulales bacterium]